MAEERVDIVIKPRLEGDGFKEATAQQEKLTEARREYKDSLRQSERKLNHEMVGDPATRSSPKAAEVAKRQQRANELKQLREAVHFTESEAGEERKAGNSPEAEKLSREASVLRKTATLMRGTGLDRDEAEKMARAQIEGAEKDAQTARAVKAAAEEKKRTEAEAAAAAKRTRQEEAATYRQAKERQTGERDALRTQMQRTQLASEEARVEGLRLRAAGDTRGARVKEREAEILHRQVQYQRTLRIDAGAALELATKRVDGEAGKRGRSGGGFGSAFGGGLLGGLLGGALGAVAGIVKDVVMMPVNRWMDRRNAEADRQSASAVSANVSQHISGLQGAEAQTLAASDSMQTREALTQAKAQRGAAKPKGWMDLLIKLQNMAPAFQLLGLHINDSADIANAENEKEIKRLEAELPTKQALAAAKFRKGPGGLALEETKARLSGRMADARALSYASLRQEKFQEYFKESGGNEDIANEGADISVRYAKFQEAQKFGRLVTGRSGSADVARAAQLASGQFGDGDRGQVTSAVRELIATVQGNHLDTLRNAEQRSPMRQ